MTPKEILHEIELIRLMIKKIRNKREDYELQSYEKCAVYHLTQAKYWMMDLYENNK